MEQLEILKVYGREILDSRGNPTVEATVTVKNHNNGRIYEGTAAVPSDKWLLFFHGYASSILWSRRWIRTMSEQGYHVLAPDMRGHGMS